MTLSSIRIAVATVVASARSSSWPSTHVAREVDRAEVAHRRLVGRGVQRDLRAQVRAVHDADVILRRADVAGILERDPRMPGLEEHRQHLAPQRAGLDPSCGAGSRRARPSPRIPRSAPRSAAVEVVQVGRFVGRKQRPRPVRDHPLHEQVGDPVRRVHVVRAAALVAGVAAQIEEVLDVVVPGLEVRAGGAAPLAAAVDRHGDVVGDLQERDDALALDLRALDAASRCRGCCVQSLPRPPDHFESCALSASALKMCAEVVLDRRQVARRELRVRACRRGTASASTARRAGRDIRS